MSRNLMPPPGRGPSRTPVAAPPSKGRVSLGPGKSPLDWARLRASGTDLRAGITSPLRVSARELTQHTSPEDAWTALGGRVFNITPYLSFHPGGKEELLRCAGRDGTQLFMTTHSWVNYEHMLEPCFIGIYIP